jgi:plasmid stability protein
VSTLHVRNVPEPIHRALRKRARERRSSVSAETIRLLGRALRVDRPGIRELLDTIERTRPLARKGAPAAADLIREDRDRR